MVNLYKHIILFIFSLVLVMGTVLLSNKSESKDRNGNYLIYYGLPFGFIEQNLNDDKNAGIYYIKFDPHKEGVSYKILFLNFFYSFALLFLFLEFLIFILENIYCYFKHKLLLKNIHKKI